MPACRWITKITGRRLAIGFVYGKTYKTAAYYVCNNKGECTYYPTVVLTSRKEGGDLNILVVPHEWAQTRTCPLAVWPPPPPPKRGCSPPDGPAPKRAAVGALCCARPTDCAALDDPTLALLGLVRGALRSECWAALAVHPLTLQRSV